jgi:hypothetical protein
LEDAPSASEVKDVPDNFKQWVKDNEERITAARERGTEPYFLRDNVQQVNSIFGADNTNIAKVATIPQYAEIEKRLGIKQGAPMTFEEANEMRGNPHYSEAESYRINCQTCVVANELRRRGFPVEALANTKGSTSELLSHATNMAWVTNGGVAPNKIHIGGSVTMKGTKIIYPKVNWKQFAEATKDPGRYHVDWKWKGKQDGHIVTFERFEDGTARWYDPQNGAVNFMTKAYAARFNTMAVLRVDNLMPNPDICSKILAKSGSKAIGGEASATSTTAGKAVSHKVSDKIKQYQAANNNRDKVSVLQQIVSDKSFKRLSYHSSKDGSIYGIDMSNFDRKLATDEMPKNLALAKKLIATKRDVYLLSNPNSTKSADFVVSRKGKLYYVEGKTLNGSDSLDHLLDKGASQSNRVCVDVIGINKTNYISDTVKQAFEQNINLQEVLLFNGSKLISVNRRIVTSKTYAKVFRQLWERAK